MAFHLLSPLLCDSSDASTSTQMNCTGAHSAVSDAHRDALLGSAAQETQMTTILISLRLDVVEI